MKQLIYRTLALATPSLIFHGLLSLSLLLAAPGSASAYYGDCGQAASDGDHVHASDALYLLYTAVGSPSYPAPLCVGDVDTSGSITASDAMLVDQKAVGQNVTLACPTGSTCTACNLSAIYSRLANLADDERVLSDTSTIFLCNPDNGEGDITVDANWSAYVAADNVIVSGRDRALHFLRHSSCPGSSPSTGVRFVDLQGDDIVLRDMTIDRFWTNVKVTGNNNTVSDVVLEHGCDASVLVSGSSTGTELRDSIVSASVAKGIRVTGSSLNTANQCDVQYTQHATGSDRTCYNFAAYDTDFINVDVPVRFAAEGRYLVKGGTMSGTPGNCSYPLVENTTSFDYYVRLEGVAISGCVGGLYAKNDADIVLDDSTLQENRKRGVLAKGSSALSLSNSNIWYNGGVTDVMDWEGGIVAAESSLVTLESPGSGEPGNVVCANIDGDDDPRNLNEDGGSIVVNSGNEVADTCP